MNAKVLSPMALQDERVRNYYSTNSTLMYIECLHHHYRITLGRVLYHLFSILILSLCKHGQYLWSAHSSKDNYMPNQRNLKGPCLSSTMLFSSTHSRLTWWVSPCCASLVRPTHGLVSAFFPVGRPLGMSRPNTLACRLRKRPGSIGTIGLSWLPILDSVIVFTMKKKYENVVFIWGRHLFCWWLT